MSVTVELSLETMASGWQQRHLIAHALLFSVFCNVCVWSLVTEWFALWAINQNVGSLSPAVLA